MSIEVILLLIFGVAILVQSFIMYVMYRRIQQQQDELIEVRERMDFSDSEIEMLVASVQGIKNFR
jgi:hypothetical protein